MLDSKAIDGLARLHDATILGLEFLDDESLVITLASNRMKRIVISGETGPLLFGVGLFLPVIIGSVEILEVYDRERFLDVIQEEHGQYLARQIETYLTPGWLLVLFPVYGDSIVIGGRGQLGPDSIAFEA